MNDAGSDNPASTETDHGRTTFSYGDGGVPLYVGIVWVVFILSYLVFMAVVALPDFIAWTNA